MLSPLLAAPALFVPVLACTALTAPAAMAATPTLTRAVAVREVRSVLIGRLRVRSPRIRSCQQTSPTSFKCDATWTHGRARASIARGQTSTAVLDHYVVDATERVARGRAIRHRRVSGDIRVAAVPQPGQSRESPLPYGATATVGDWHVKVLSATPDATAEVMAESSYNDPPAAGRQFYIVDVQATYVGTSSGSFSDLNPQAVGPAAVAYATYSDYCGTIPDPIDTNDVFPNGTVTGNVCWSVLSTDAVGLTMYLTPPGGHATFFSLGS